MDTPAESILNLCLEIEGLLALLQRRQDSTPREVYIMLKEKSSILNDSIHALDCGEKEVATNSSEEVADFADVIVEPIENHNESEVESTPPGEIESESDEESTIEHQILDLKNAIADLNVTEDNESDITYGGTPVELTDKEEYFTTTPLNSITDNVSYGEPNVRDLSSRQPVSFTINDKYRFRRELFGNSDAEMADALNVVNAMNSVEEVEEYFYNDLCWDPDNEDVKDFIRIVNNTFSN